MEEKINNFNKKEQIVSSPRNEKNIKKWDKWLANIGKFINFGNIFFGLVVGVIVTCAFIKDIVYKTAADEKFLHKVASHVRPAWIFEISDENTGEYSILADQGGSEYIEDIDISFNKSDPNGGPLMQMVVHPKTHLAYQPFIQSMSANNYEITAKRGRKNDWILTLITAGTCGDKYIFRLEIIN